MRPEPVECTERRRDVGDDEWPVASFVREYLDDVREVQERSSPAPVDARASSSFVVSSKSTWAATAVARGAATALTLPASCSASSGADRGVST
jgi:hypothetical protein